MIKIKKLILSAFLLSIANTSVLAQSFTNPVLSGFYPDPSICRADDGYYLINSTFTYYPGLPIFYSRDLMNWKQIGYVLDRPEQLDLDGLAVTYTGLYAPTIRYHNGVFYVVCTNIGKIGNFIVTAKNPKGPWSNPVSLPEVDGIDPSLFFDPDGKVYLVYNSKPPNNIPLYEGHCTIRLYEFDSNELKVKGEQKILVNGGTDITKKPIWIEGPHLFKKDGWYYLIAAEGGTEYNHSEVVFRSRQVEGPYVSYEKNPILTQRHLNAERPNPVTSTGHADFVEDKNGNWWTVFLGCRPYEGDYYNTGRETFMAPVEWKDGWPVVSLGGNEVKYSYSLNAVADKNAEKLNGNFLFRDEFENSTLDVRYSFLRTVRNNWYSLANKKGALSINLRPQTIQGKENPSFVGFRQSHQKGYAATAMQFYPKAENEKAGLLVFENENHFYFLCKSIQEGKEVVQLYKGPGNKKAGAAPELLASQEVISKKAKDLFLKAEANGSTYSFFYAVKKNKWKPLLLHADAKFLSTKEAGGFVGCMYAMYATSTGQQSENAAMFNWFESRSNDEVYKK